MKFTVNPGPSQLSSQTEDDIRRAIEEGVLSLSHRSSQFTEISRHCVDSLRAYLSVPNDYRTFYFDSATQVWHSLAANVVEKHSFHFVNGAFSGKAHDAAKALGKSAVKNEVAWGEQNDFSRAAIPEGAELITACYNETSTGVCMQPEDVHELRAAHQEALLAIDVTSCAGAVPLTISDADIWYFSVQKCFGLPAGLAIAIVSPRAYERSVELTTRGTNLAGIWSWQRLEETMINDKFQTPHTPNVLNIYLLGKQCARFLEAGGVDAIHRQTLEKKSSIEEWVLRHPALSPFVHNVTHRSDTVFTVRATPEFVTAARNKCKDAGITLGAGYGKIKGDTFRIANFPAVTREMLLDVFEAIHSVTT